MTLYLLLSLCLLGGFFWCCCGEPPPPPPDCTVFEDDFNRSDSSSLGSDWTENAGDWSIASNALAISSGSAEVKCNTPSPNVERAISVKVRGTVAGNQARVVLGLGGGTKWYVHVNFSTTAGSVRIFEGATERNTSATNLNLALSTFHQLEICYSGGRLEAEIVGVARSYVHYDTTALTDLNNGLATGTVSSGTVSFEDFVLDDVDEDEDCFRDIVPSGGEQGCLYCTGLRGPYYWLVELAEIVNVSGGTCVHCGLMNLAYVLKPDANIQCFEVIENTACCCWTAPINAFNVCAGSSHPDPATLNGRVTLQVCNSYPGGPSHMPGIAVRAYRQPLGGFSVYAHSQSIQIDCKDKSGLSIARLFGSTWSCDDSSATATVTAL